MQQFPKTKETKEHFARFSGKVLRGCCRCTVLNKVENRTTKTFDKGISHSIYKACLCMDCMTISLIPLEDQMIQINVSILYANTTGFIVIVEEKNMQTPYFQRKWTIRRVFCYGNELLWLHLSTNKDS